MRYITYYFMYIVRAENTRKQLKRIAQPTDFLAFCSSDMIFNYTYATTTTAAATGSQCV